LAIGVEGTERRPWKGTDHAARNASQTYGITNGTFQELAETAKSGMLPKFQGEPGFVRYGLADLGDKTCMSISVWETRAQAEAASPGGGNVGGREPRRPHSS
jgi:hypothetical protein